MGSDSLFTKCNTCGKEISKSAKVCPQCGAKQKKISITHWIVIVSLVFIIIWIVNNTDNKTSSNEVSSNTAISSKSAQSMEYQMPEDQRKFVQIITNYAEGFRGAKNELQQSNMRDQRKMAISSSLGSYSINFWIGTIHKLETNSEGKAILSVHISPEIKIKTWNNAFSDLASNTLIEKGSPVYNSLFHLSNGQRVRFSGTFIPSGVDFIEETSMTIDGSMINPEFLFKFKTVTSINEGEENGAN